MRCTHYDAVLVSERLVACVVHVEHAVPHGWPEVVGLGPEQQFEDPRVELSPERCAVGRDGVTLIRPACQSWSLIVDEEAAVLDGRTFLDLCSLEQMNGIVLLGWYIGEPVPWRDANLLGDIVDTVDSATSITTCGMLDSELDEAETSRTSNDKRFSSHVTDVLHNSADIGLPLTLNLADVELATRDQVINQA